MIVKVVEGVAVVGVPEIAPVALFNVRPAESAGLAEYDVTVPVTVGVSYGIDWPTVTVSRLGINQI